MGTFKLLFRKTGLLIYSDLKIVIITIICTTGSEICNTIHSINFIPFLDSGYVARLYNIQFTLLQGGGKNAIPFDFELWGGQYDKCLVGCFDHY